ncbi:hypothetical protein D3C80_2189550 [compost metagenome]
MPSTSRPHPSRESEIVTVTIVDVEIFEPNVTVTDFSGLTLHARLWSKSPEVPCV